MIVGFLIIHGATGPTGPTGPSGGPTGPAGPQGNAATIQVGTVTTGDPGSNAQVTNSGTENNAILNFVIPRGDPGTPGASNTLAAIDTSDQASLANGALTFNQTPFVSGSAIAHEAGTANIQITQTGIYQAFLQSTATVNTGTAVPSTLTVQLQENGNAVPGASARHIFSAVNEMATLSFAAPFSVNNTPASLQIVTNETGYTFHDLSLTMIRLGNLS